MSATRLWKFEPTYVLLTGALAISCQSTASPNSNPTPISPETPSPRLAVQRAATGTPTEKLPAPTPSLVPTVLAKAAGQLGPGKGVLLISIVPPEGAELTPDAPILVKGSGGIGLEFPENLSGNLSEHRLPLALPVEVQDGATGPAEVSLSYYWCTDGENAACRRERVIVNVQLDLTGSGAGGEAHFEYKPQSPTAH